MKKSFLDTLLSNLEAWSQEADAPQPETRLAELQSIEARQALAEVTLALLQRWKMHKINQAELLGCRDVEPILQENILPVDAELMQRVGHLLGIERALKALFPYTPTARDNWIWRHNDMLAGKSPMEVMLDEGLSGIRRVRKLLEDRLKAGRMA